MTTDYAKAWEYLPAALRDKLGTDEHLTADDMDGLVRVEVARREPNGTLDMQQGFREFAAYAMDDEADSMLDPSVQVAKEPLRPESPRPGRC